MEPPSSPDIAVGGRRSHIAPNYAQLMAAQECKDVLVTARDTLLAATQAIESAFAGLENLCAEIEFLNGLPNALASTSHVIDRVGINSASRLENARFRLAAKDDAVGVFFDDYSHDESDDSSSVIVMLEENTPPGMSVDNRSRSKKRYYVVAVGRKVGIFNDAAEAGHAVEGVPNGQRRGYKRYSDARSAFIEAFGTGQVLVYVG